MQALFRFSDIKYRRTAVPGKKTSAAAPPFFVRGAAALVRNGPETCRRHESKGYAGGIQEPEESGLF